MRQSRAMSLAESATNVLVGFGVAVLMQMGIFPLFGLKVSLGGHLRIGAMFTAVSLLRSFLLRRGFEALRARAERSDAAGW